MTGQESLELGRTLRDVGIAQAEEAVAGGRWRPWARVALGTLASTGRPFNADHLEQMREKDGAPEPESRMAVGGLFNAAARAGVIERTGQWVQMTSPGAHARMTALWRGTEAWREAPWTKGGYMDDTEAVAA
jgi:hypothetical protein